MRDVGTSARAGRPQSTPLTLTLHRLPSSGYHALSVFLRRMLLCRHQAKRTYVFRVSALGCQNLLFNPPLPTLEHLEPPFNSIQRRQNLAARVVYTPGTF